MFRFAPFDRLAQLAYMNQQNLLDILLTDDANIFSFEADFIARNVDFFQERFDLIQKTDILEVNI